MRDEEEMRKFGMKLKKFCINSLDRYFSACYDEPVSLMKED